MSVRKSALIPAAGMGTRLGLGPKCLLRLGGKTLIERVVDTLLPLVDEVLVAAPGGFEDALREVLGDSARVVTGGNTRQDSIDAMFHICTGEFIVIQDGARPFASRALTAAVLDAAREHGAAGAFLDPSVPVGHLVDGVVASYRTRQEARIFQAPQAYRREVLMDARRKSAGRQFQSTAQMVIDAGYALWAVPGEPENIKITSPLDWLIAQRAIAPSLGLDS